MIYRLCLSHSETAMNIYGDVHMMARQKNHITYYSQLRMRLVLFLSIFIYYNHNIINSKNNHVYGVYGSSSSSGTTSSSTTTTTNVYVPDGLPTSSVMIINKDNIQTAIHSDPANPFWLFKFFAPWCGHCKKLAPVLEKVATATSGTMSIGTIDCTIEKKLCDTHKVRGYPTLKFSIDGEIYDYTNGRSVRDFVDFSQKMIRPIIDMVSSIDDAYQHMTDHASDTNGVAFILYDPSITIIQQQQEKSKDPIHDTIQSSSLGQLFGQISRKLRATGSFLLLHPSALKDNDHSDNKIESSKEVMYDFPSQNGSVPFLCRIEMNVPPRCHPNILSSTTTTTLNQFIQWVDNENIPTVTMLGAHNFYKMGRNGKPLVIAVINEQEVEQVQLMKENFIQYAIHTGPDHIRNKYYYTYMDGNIWKNFLSQFDIVPQDIPQIFVLDVPTKQYWQNSTYKLNIHDLLFDIDKGIISSKVSSPDGIDGLLIKLYRYIMIYRPWSIVLIVIFISAILIGIFICIQPSKEEIRRPLYEKIQDDIQPWPTATTIDDKTNQKSKETPVTDSKDDNENESKKEQ